MTVYYNPHTPVYSCITDWRKWKNTCFKAVFKTVEFWAFIFLHTALVSLLLARAGETGVGALPASAAALVQFFSTFFLTFYNQHCYERYEGLYTHTMDILDGATLFVHEMTVSLNHPELECHRNLAAKYVLATVYVFFMTLTGGKLSASEWKEVSRKGLLTKAETEALAAYPGGDVTLVLTVWAMVVIDNALEEDCCWKPHQERIAHVHNRINNCMLKMITACGRVARIVAMPIPFPYFHLMNLVLTTSFVLIAGVLALLQTHMTVVPYGAVVAVFLGLRNVANCLADPFGEDDVDFPVSHFINYTIDQTLCLLETFEHMDKTFFDKTVEVERNFTDAQLTKSVDQNVIYKGGGHLQQHNNWYRATVADKFEKDEDAILEMQGALTTHHLAGADHTGIEWMTDDDITEAFDKLYAETSGKEKMLQNIQKQIESLENDMKAVGFELPDRNPYLEEARKAHPDHFWTAEDTTRKSFHHDEHSPKRIDHGGEATSPVSPRAFEPAAHSRGSIMEHIDAAIEDISFHMDGDEVLLPLPAPENVPADLPSRGATRQDIDEGLRSALDGNDICILGDGVWIAPDPLAGLTSGARDFGESQNLIRRALETFATPQQLALMDNDIGVMEGEPVPDADVRLASPPRQCVSIDICNPEVSHWNGPSSPSRARIPISIDCYNGDEDNEGVSTALALPRELSMPLSDDCNGALDIPQSSRNQNEDRSPSKPNPLPGRPDLDGARQLDKQWDGINASLPIMPVPPNQIMPFPLNDSLPSRPAPEPVPKSTGLSFNTFQEARAITRSLKGQTTEDAIELPGSRAAREPSRESSGPQKSGQKVDSRSGNEGGNRSFKSFAESRSLINSLLDTAKKPTTSSSEPRERSREGSREKSRDRTTSREGSRDLSRELRDRMVNREGSRDSRYSASSREGSRTSVSDLDVETGTAKGSSRKEEWLRQQRRQERSNKQAL